MIPDISLSLSSNVSPKYLIYRGKKKPVEIRGLLLRGLNEGNDKKTQTFLGLIQVHFKLFR